MNDMKTMSKMIILTMNKIILWVAIMVVVDNNDAVVDLIDINRNINYEKEK